MKSVHKIALAALALAGCSSSDGASTTVAASVAPPTPPPTTTTTTIAPTTTAPSPTTAGASTTAPPTTATQTPEEVITERHLAFGDALDTCFVRPDACDPSDAFTSFVTPDSEPYKFYAASRDQLVAARQRVTQPERIERNIVLAEVDADGLTGHTVNCVRHAGVYLDPDGQVLPSSVAFGREDYFWELRDGQWVATQGILHGISEQGDGQCTF